MEKIQNIYLAIGSGNDLHYSSKLSPGFYVLLSEEKLSSKLAWGQQQTARSGCIFVSNIKKKMLSIPDMI